MAFFIWLISILVKLSVITSKYILVGKIESNTINKYCQLIDISDQLIIYVNFID